MNWLLIIYALVGFGAIIYTGVDTKSSEKIKFIVLASLIWTTAVASMVYAAGHKSDRVIVFGMAVILFLMGGLTFGLGYAKK
jgi:hypothetical protein